MLKSTTIKKKDFLFVLAYTLLIIYRVIKSSTMGINDHGVMYIIISLIFVARIMTLKMTYYKFISIMLLIPIVFMSVVTITDPVVLVVFLALMASKGIEFDYIVKISNRIVLPLVLAIVFLAFIGLLSDTVTVRYLAGKSINCHGMGFNHSSALPTYFCFWYLGYCYLKKTSIKIWEVLVGLLIGYVIFLTNAERLRFYMLFIIAILLLIRPFVANRFNRFKVVFMSALFPVLCICTVLCGYLYQPSNSIMYSINILLSNRLYLEKCAFNAYPITWFGTVMSMGEDALIINGNLSYFYLDSGYCYIFFAYGIIISILIISAYTLGAYKSAKSNDYILMIWFFVMAIDTIIGNQLMSIWITPVLFLYFCETNPNRTAVESKS